MFKQLDLFASFQEPESPSIKAPEQKEAAAVIIEEKMPVEETHLLLQENEVIQDETEEEVIQEEIIQEKTVRKLVVPERVIEEELVMAEMAPVYNVHSSEKKIAHAKPKPGKRGRKSLKEMSDEFEMITIPEDEILFKKQYYSIGEVSSMFQLNTSLLRYWETEFDILKPRKNRKGDRHFRPEDIKNLYLIHHLLRQRKYTIEGAKDYLKKNKSKAQQNFELIQRLEKLKGFLLELKAGL
jgi:DNA-binding transcriptional MerR regulator